MTQLSLLAPAPVRTVDSIDLRCCSVDDVLAEVRGARLIVADPPWRYMREAGVANPETHGIYDGLNETEIAAHLDLAYDCAGPACRLAVWYTWPKDAEWTNAGGAGPRWGDRVTGGAWTKHQLTVSGSYRPANPGVGYHWRGDTEPVALFTKGATGRASECFPNGHVTPLTEHSEKPVDWLRAWVRAWTSPGDLVLDLYAGLAPMARACALEGRRYVGAEIDPERHRLAMLRLRGAL